MTIALIVFNSFWIAFGPLLFVNLFFLASIAYYAATGGPKRHQAHDAARRHESKFLNQFFREWWIWWTDPVARFFVRQGLGPNAVSCIGFIFSPLAGFLFAKGYFGYAGWAMVVGATFDIFDGRVARLTGSETRSGAFFDSTLDRWSEGICYTGLAFYFRNNNIMLFLVMLALIGSTLVSYAKARGESVGVCCKGGSMQRAERIVYLGVASIFQPIVTSVFASLGIEAPFLVMAALLLLAVMTNVTGAYRMVFVMNELDRQDLKGEESLPQILHQLTTVEGRETLWDRARYGYDRSRSRAERIVLFLMQGIETNVFHELLHRGDLPNLARIKALGGMSGATSCFPSAAGIAVAPLTTGCFPGTCDIPGITWFDRHIPEGRVLSLQRFRDYQGLGGYAMDYDVAKEVRTLFEYSRQAVNIFSPLGRGCGLTRDPAFFHMHGRLVAPATRDDFEEALDVAFQWFTSALRRETDVVLYRFPGMVGGVNHDENVRHAYRRIDQEIGRAGAMLEKHQVQGETQLYFTAEHSFGLVEREWDFTEYLRTRLNAIAWPSRLREWTESEAISLVTGTSMVNLYLRKESTWNGMPYFEELEKEGIVPLLLERDEIDLLAGRSRDGGILVASKRGRAQIIENTDGSIAYLVKGSDPFGYPALPQVQTSQSLFETSFATDYPDGILQIAQLFRSKRAGDLVVSAAPHVSLRSGPDAQSFSSGSLHRQHISVPILSSKPLPSMRTADLFAIILDELGITPEHRMDGMLR
ncbi:MAG: alkaline phosphatase family protein [Deltaproteobacteria bacterium]|nr:alkaline phosphatase family protein [Deltaproteobacteria bacterium]